MNQVKVICKYNIPKTFIKDNQCSNNFFLFQFSLIAVSSKQDKQEETKTSGTSEKDSKTDASEK